MVDTGGKASQDCHAIHGRLGTGTATISEAIELYLDDCRESGDPVPTEAGREFVDIDSA
jgi:hypothetical protein